jgi:hypothetical protein
MRLLSIMAHSNVDNMFVHNIKFSWFVNAIKYIIYMFAHLILNEFQKNF